MPCPRGDVQTVMNKMHVRTKSLYFDNFNLIVSKMSNNFSRCLLSYDMIYQVKQQCLLSTMGNYADVASEGKTTNILFKNLLQCQEKNG